MLEPVLEHQFDMQDFRWYLTHFQVQRCGLAEALSGSRDLEDLERPPTSMTFS